MKKKLKITGKLEKPKDLNDLLEEEAKAKKKPSRKQLRKMEEEEKHNLELDQE